MNDKLKKSSNQTIEASSGIKKHLIPATGDKKDNSIILFNQKEVRRYWDVDQEQWYFSVVDIIEILTDSINPQTYWRKLKERLKAEGNETVTNCHSLKMKARDGKMRLTDTLDTENILRLIQSIPSPKAEPFKLWLAKVGYQRIEETEDPELAFERAMKTYLKKGYSKEWINQRLKTIEVRKELTDEWQERGMKEGLDYAILTDEITKAWSDITTKEYRQLKNLKKENLRDNMTNLELVLNMLAEASTTEISKKQRPVGLVQNKIVAKKGGTVAKKARLDLEQQLGEDVVTSKNYQSLKDNNKKIK
jgi:hypothetical protein